MSEQTLNEVFDIKEYPALERSSKLLEKAQDAITANEKLNEEIRNRVSDIDENYEMDDEQFIVQELKEQIRRNKKIQQDMERELGVGSPARVVEVYTQLSAQIMNDINALRDMNQRKMDFKLKIKNAKVNETKSNAKINIGNLTQVNAGNGAQAISAAEMLKIAMASRKASESKMIEAKFDIKTE